jgi:hypothetical protein
VPLFQGHHFLNFIAKRIKINTTGGLLNARAEYSAFSSLIGQFLHPDDFIG